jgi:hypothetical protein
VFTKQRFKPPQITGDASKDVYELGLAIAKYLRTLEDKGALTLDQATIDGTTVGATTPSTGNFTTLSSTGNTTLGDASTDTLNVGNGDIVKDSSGRVGIGVTPTTALEVNGVISLRDTGTKNLNAGVVTEVQASLIDIGINEGSGNRFGGAYTQANQGGMIAIDARAGTNLFTFYGRQAGVAAVTGTALLTMDSAGQLVAASSITSTGGIMSAPLQVKCDNTSAANTVWMGYTTRASQTQLTSKATATTCNGQVCRITMNGAALAAGTIVSFVLTNSAISNAGNENWFAFHESAGTLGAYTVTITPTGLLTATVTVRNNTAGSLSEAIVIGLVKFGG